MPSPPSLSLSRLVLLTLAIALAAFAPRSASATADCRPAEQLADKLLQGEASGQLPLNAGYLLDEALLDQGRWLARVELEFALPATSQLCLALLVDNGEALQVAHRQRLRPTGGGQMVYSAAIELPEDVLSVLAVVQLGDGPWAAVQVEEADARQHSAGSAAVHLNGAGKAWYQITVAATPGAKQQRQTVVRIIPPRRQPATGSTRFDTLISSPEVRRVIFFLDGKQVAEDRLRPYNARLNLASPARTQEVRVEAWGRGGEVLLGKDSFEVNRLDAPFRVWIRNLRPRAGGAETDLEVEVTVPADGQLSRVEVYRNEQLVETLSQPPFRARIATANAGPSDWIRVAAYLADGRTIDDVVLLASDAGGEEVEVNLVEIRLVVTDEMGAPVEDLRQDEFEILLDDRPRTLDSLAYADDVPLLMGLVIDTSGSMRLLMPATQRAAARFLSDTLRPEDQAFLVDFDQQPRLRQPITGDMGELIRGLGQLNPEGATALYDAVVFSMLQFERQPGRKALVVLSDGDDRDSRYGPKNGIEMGRKTGVPVYIIGLGALDDIPRTYPKRELRKLTSETGGRLYFVDSVDQLSQAYAEINAELRSQYTVRFYADRDLAPADLRQLEVRLRRPGLRARVVLGSNDQE